MSDSVQPHRQQPTRLCHPWDSPGKNTGVGCHFLLKCMKVKSESEGAQLCPTLCDPVVCSPPGSSVHGIFQAGGCHCLICRERQLSPKQDTYQHHIVQFQQKYKYNPQTLSRKALINFENVQLPSHLRIAKFFVKNAQEHNPGLIVSEVLLILYRPDSIFQYVLCVLLCFICSLTLFCLSTCLPGYSLIISGLINIDRKKKEF